jgi:hypothetical protein
MRTFDGLVLGLRSAELRIPGAFRIISVVSRVPEKKIREISEEKVQPTQAERMALEGLM